VWEKRLDRLGAEIERRKGARGSTNGRHGMRPRKNKAR